MSLAEARDARDEARRQIRNGVDPVAIRRERKFAAVSGDSFGALAEEWLAKRENELTPGHVRTIRSRLDRDLLPYLAHAP